MNQEKIGKFIAERRKIKKLTQVELAERLGVSDRSVSKWETGKCMPDLSLFEPLCKELEIKVNELLSGEQIVSDNYQEKCEDNIINTIDYTNKKITNKNKNLGVILLVFGFLIVLTAISIFPSESSWSSVYSVFGCIVALTGFSKFTKKLDYLKRVLFNFGFFILFVILLFTLDYANVAINRQVPRFSYNTETLDKIIFYQAPFYNAFRINTNSVNEYYIIDYAKEYTIDTVPTSPFNRDKSGIDNLMKYKNKYVGNNSNNGNLINSLPLSEYGYVFEIDSKDLGLIIDYHTTDWYNNENNYIQRALIYNSVSIFMLIDNVEYITYNFSGNSYTIKRDNIEKEYSDYLQVIKDNKIDKEKFNKYVENQMNDYNFVIKTFEKLF
ncbi:MAG: DUF4825 domain-containing protein [Bacilli bacterium]|jgi:transcriptional regulator with XRE-family HTH domain|uniref:DUF4825 domain-containing protein n=1 Tax=Anaerorhabdus sp. TaxID=1872524 RepID=UPI002FC92B11